MKPMSPCLPVFAPKGRRLAVGGSVRLAAAILVLLGLASGCGPAPEDFYAGALPERVDFNFHVKPIISDRCFACHGPDEAAREADLRLDTRAGVLGVVRGGSLRRSPLFQRITADDPAERMPPEDSHLHLSDYEIALIGRWIEQGAEWKPHWAFLAPVEPELPEVENEGWVENPIDRFILARLELEGLTPSPEAERERLIRRVTYDLTGLPPKVAEVDAFLADRSPHAYEKVVDRLLASPAYGERMAAIWLDVSRYADSHGYQDDGIRYMWRWRDWVIEAFNRNLPYDQFVTWQLAGDLLPAATREQILATGFNRNHPQNAEGGIVDEEYRVEYVADRTNTFGTAFLGLTMECARCHDHKYDPISQREYYQLFGFFNNNHEIGISPIDGNPGPTLLLLTEEEEARLADIRTAVEARRLELRDYLRGIARRAEEGGYLRRPTDLDASVRRGLVGHFPLDRLTEDNTPNLANPALSGEVEREPEIVEGVKGGALHIVEGGIISVPEAYKFDRTDAFTLSAWIQPTQKQPYAPILSHEESGNRNHRGYELSLQEGRVSASLTHHWPTDAIRITTVDSVPLGEWTHVVMTYDGSSRAGGLSLYVNGKPAAFTVDADRLERTIVMDRLSFMIGRKGGSTDPSAFEGGKIDEVRVYDRALSSLEAARLAGLDPVDELPEDPGRWDAHQRRQVLTHQVRQESRYGALRRAIREKAEEENQLLSAAEDVMVMQELPTPRPTYVLERGAYDARGERVRPATPAALPEFPADAERNRLGLARWLFAPEQPLTARVAGNRHWQMLFGTGLVKTAEDFGSQGEIPSHPELLDWLAVTYRDSGWDTKALLKTIVMSATYRQASVRRPDLREKDPENRLLARGPSHRLPAEMIRDGALAASGLLVPEIGGPSVKPYQPPGLWEEKSAGRGALATYEQDHGDALYRRTMYSFWKRSSPPPMQISFDAAERNVCTVRRQSTNTPTQALNLLNDPQQVEAARLLAERMLREGGETDADRIRFGFRAVVSRGPAAEEIGLLASLLEEELAVYEQNRPAAARLLTVGEYPRDRDLAPERVAAFTVVANTLLNLDEAVTKR